MKVTLLSCLVLGAVGPALASVSIEFQLGGFQAPAGATGVLVADAANDGFVNPSQAGGGLLTPGATWGGDDVVVAVFSFRNLAQWGGQQGFAEHLATIDYGALGLTAGDPLTLHVFPERTAGQALRSGEPHLSYREGDAGQRTSNSTMGFALPPDGGAHVLGLLGSAQSGTADLAMLDVQTFPYASGSGQVNATLSATARHTYFFEVLTPGFLSLEGIAAEGLVAELYGPDGEIIGTRTGNDVLFFEALETGFHVLVLSRETGAVGDLAYQLDFADEDTRMVIPDLAVGATPGGLVGAGILDGAPGQLASLISRHARPVAGIATVANRSERSDALALTGTAGSRLCGIAYYDAGGNVSAAMAAGTYRTESITNADAAEVIHIQFAPNRKKLSKTVGKRTVIKRKTFPATLRVSATQGAAASDAATLQALTR